MKKLLSIILLTLFITSGFIYSQDSSAEKTNRMKPALLVIDIQNAYLPMMDKSEKDRAMEMINWYIGMFRENGFPIIRVYHTDRQYGPPTDSEEFEYPTTVNIKPDDPKVIKNYGDAFNKTDLDKIIKEKGSNTLFLCGLSAVGCVLATYVGAQNYDYNVFFIKDALISHNTVYTKSIEEIFGAVSYDVIRVMLENAEK